MTRKESYLRATRRALAVFFVTLALVLYLYLGPGLQSSLLSDVAPRAHVLGARRFSNVNAEVASNEAAGGGGDGALHAAAPPNSSAAKAAAAPLVPPIPGRVLAPGRRYFIVQMVVEGFGAWSDAIYETINVAVRLNRTWVEPCVRNGCIEPCRCGAIRGVAPWDAAAAGAGADPLLLPYIDDRCKLDLPPEVRPPDHVAEAYPLSAYLDMDAIAAEYDEGRIVRYADWCATFEAEAAPAIEPRTRRWIWPRGYNFDMQTGNVAVGTPTAVGDMFFEAQVLGHLETREAGMALLAAEPENHLFLFHYYRGMFAYLFEYPVVPINRWHTAAAARFVEAALGGPPFVAFHWRSEGVDPNMLGACSEELASLAAAALPGFVAEAAGSRRRAVLVSDMPAPSNPNRAWTDYRNGEGAEQHGAMATMLSRGFRKYDAAVTRDGVQVDSGVLSIRDYLLSASADWYVTCQGDHWADCHGCFRAGSNIVERIRRDRERKRLPTSLQWYRIATLQLPDALNASASGVAAAA